MSSSGFYTNTSDPSFLSELKDCLKKCTYFDWTVSFIKKAGLVLVLDDIEKALARGARGRILTSTYQNFTDLGSLDIFLGLQEKYKDRFSCHLEYESFGEDGFHTKGYIFGFDDHEEILIGSSNITRFALLKNKEWDVSVSDNESDPFMMAVGMEFDYLWKCTNDKVLSQELRDKYAEQLKNAVFGWDMDYVSHNYEKAVTPNFMQQEALLELTKIRNMHIDRALIVAATGSGKTYLSAFDAKNFGAQKLLFIVHRDVILKDAMNTFKRIFGPTRSYGLYTGDQKDEGVDFLFASNQMLARSLDQFDPKQFDYIVVDEVHHAAASTYQKIINYFVPSFLLGMTATPDRMDEQDVYQIFGNHVPYDLRLRDAIQNDLVVPFHYYGIKDSLVDYKSEGNEKEVQNLVKQLVAPDHIDFIIENIERYRKSDMSGEHPRKGITGKLKCIGFCRTKEHARLMADEMTKRGYQATYLLGENDVHDRLQSFKRLQDDHDPLQFIFAVDILNEGVDIPSINMVLFLRPTDSSTILLQQLGRGLRKYENKEFLIVLDFIGNSYRRSVLIARALGTLTKVGVLSTKKEIYDLVRNPKEVLGLPNVEIYFDEESQDEILSYTDSLDTLAFKKADYEGYKKYLIDTEIIEKDSYPLPADFLNAETSIDLDRFRTAKSDCYYDFLLQIKEKNCPVFEESKANVLRSMFWFLPLVRREEFEILKALKENPLTYGELLSQLLKQGCKSKSVDHALKILQKYASFMSAPNYLRPLIKQNTSGAYELDFSIEDKTFEKWFDSILEYGLTKFEIDFYGDYDIYKEYQRYTISQVLLAKNTYSTSVSDKPNLNWQTGIYPSEIGLIVFVNMNKDKQKDEMKKYQDAFISKDIFRWESQGSTTMSNAKGHQLLETKRVYLFARKTKNDKFCYFGMGDMTNPQEVFHDKTTYLQFDIKLDNPVPKEYEYEFGIPKENN